MERLVSGAGWTQAATQKFLDCETDEDKIKQLYAMFTINDEQYRRDAKAAGTIDFHFANGIWCIEQNFDMLQTQFVCRTMDRLLQNGIQQMNTPTESGEKLSFEKLRVDLFNQFHTAFNDLNQGDWHFTPENTKKIINFYNQVFFRPLRLVLYTFTHDRGTQMIPEKRAVFSPIDPVPLSECVEMYPDVDEELEFKPLELPKGTLNLEDAREMIQKYTDNMIETINKRYDILTDMINKVQPPLDSNR